MRNPNHRVGVRPNGEIKPPNETGNGQHGQFEPEVIKVQPEYNRAGDTPAQVGTAVNVYARGLVFNG